MSSPICGADAAYMAFSILASIARYAPVLSNTLFGVISTQIYTVFHNSTWKYSLSHFIKVSRMLVDIESFN